MSTEHKGYKVYDYDRLTPGHSVKIEHTVYNDENTDLSDLLKLTVDEVSALKEKNVEQEQAAYEKAIGVLKDWEALAANTRKYENALDYKSVPEVSHTSNKWEKDGSDRFTISNKVYKMTYDIYERSSWRNNTIKYDVRWHIYTNRQYPQISYKVAGQERACATREEAEKYIQGRIKAYSHLFTEISPPIPKDLEKSFMVHGHLLPGYVTEEMQKATAEKSEKPAEKKASIRKQLNELKADQKKNPQEPQKTRPENEIG